MARHIGFIDIAQAIVSFFKNLNTAPRTYTFQDRDGIIADLEDIQAVAPGTINYETLTFGATTNWDITNKTLPKAKLIVTGNTVLNIIGAKDGAEGVIKIITSTASAITITFDTDFINKRTGLLGEEAFTTYTFPASTDKEYILTFIIDTTTINWSIADFSSNLAAKPFAMVTRLAAQSAAHNTNTAIIYDTENEDNSNIWSIGQPTRLVIPGSGNKIATISFYAVFLLNSLGIRRITVFKNGAVLSTGLILPQVSPPSTTNDSTIIATFQLPCVGGDYFETIVYQNSTISLNINIAQATISISDR